MDDINMDIILLCFQVFVWVSCIFKLWNRNRFYAIFCMVIYLYLLPTEITYRFFPYLYDAYWGKDVWCELYWFVNFSLITLFIVLNHTSKIHKVYNVVYYRRRNSKSIVCFFVLVFSFLSSYLLVTNMVKISYQSLVENGSMGNENILMTIIDQMFKWLPAFVIFPMVAMEQKKCYMQVFTAYNILLYTIYNILSGSRSDILAVILGLVLLWIYGRKIRIKQVFVLSFIAITFLYLASFTYSLRGGVNEGTLEEILLKQDYTAPAYNLVGVIGKNIIDPLMVINSQIIKTFPLLGGDWLYFLIADSLFPSSQVSASQGWAFHPFAEGYIFCGFLGFVYNGLVIGLGLSIWNRFILTNNERFNRFMFAIMGCIFFSLVRSQSVNFFRYMYYMFIPSAYIYSRLSNIKINYRGFLR